MFQVQVKHDVIFDDGVYDTMIGVLLAYLLCLLCVLHYIICVIVK